LISFVSSQYSINIAVEIENLLFLVNYNNVQLIYTLRLLDRSWKIYFLQLSKCLRCLLRENLVTSVAIYKEKGTYV